MTGTDYNDIFRAVARQDATGLRALIAAGENVNTPDLRPWIGHMNTPLHMAASTGNVELARILLDAGAQVDARCLGGWTPLMRACNAGAFDVAKLLVSAGADIDAENVEGYSAYGRIPGSAASLLAFVRFHRALRGIGVLLPAAIALESAVAGRPGMIVICGPAGSGKTTLAELLREYAGNQMLGDLRQPDEIVRALSQARRESVVCVVRSGESVRLASRWRDMGIPQDVATSASVTTITLRRLPGADPRSGLPNLLVVEILAPDGSCLTGWLAEQAKALVLAGLVTADSARFNVPDYE